jgi:hypothetical protein
VRDINISNDLDLQLAALPKDEALAIHLSGSLETKGVYRAGQYESRNLGKGWTFDGDAEISLVAPFGMDSQLLCLLSGPAQSVKGISLRGNQSLLAPGWQGALRTGGVWLDGDGAIDHVTFHDFGARGIEAFVAVIADGSGAASITNCLFTDWVASASNTQVTVFLIAGTRDPAAPGLIAGSRSSCLMEGNETQAGAGNWVQGHTIYQVTGGTVRNNKTTGARIGYYGDYFATKGITIEGNQFLGCEHGVQLQLSPTGETDADPAYFSHENYTIGPNAIQSTGANVMLDTLGPSTATSYIRNIAVDASLSLENNGATNVTRTGIAAKKGCNPFGFLHR